MSLSLLVRLRFLVFFSTGKVRDMANTAACQAFLHAMSDVVNRYFERSGRRWVDLGALFDGMKL